MLASFECNLVNFFSSLSPVSFLRHSHISVPGFVRSDVCFGWRRFRYLRLRRDFAPALLSFGAIVWSIGALAFPVYWMA